MSQGQMARITAEVSASSRERDPRYVQGSNASTQSPITRQPIQISNHRTHSTKTVESILEDFDPRERHLGQRGIRIADIQRYASWQLAKKQKLVDSVLKNMEINQITAAQNFDASGQYSDILDGQTRLTTLHEFKNGQFPLADGAYWMNLTPQEQFQFLGYQVSWAELKKTRTMSPEEFDELCCDEFERLNSGKQLTSNEMFHSRHKSPVMQFVLSLKHHPIYGPKIKKYLCADLGGNKKFTGLAEFAGIVIASMTKRPECITTSYAVNGPFVIRRQITQEDKNTTYSFLDKFFGIVERNIPNPRNNVQRSFIKLSEITGMMLFDWITSPPGETHDDMWNAFMTPYHLNSKNFIEKLFENVSESQQRNSYGLASKLSACIEAFTNGGGSFEHMMANTSEHNNDGGDADNLSEDDN
jgi:hypothetical protein